MAETFQDSLSVTEATGNSNVSLTATSSDSQIRLESVGNPLRVGIDPAIGAAIGTVNSFPLSIQTDGETRIHIQKDGNVGIGAPSSSAKLAIDGSLQLKEGIAVNKFANDVNLVDNNDLAVPTSKAVKTYVSNSVAPLQVALNTKAALAGNPGQDFAARNLTVNGNLTTTGSLTAMGSIGIGTANPYTQLTLTGSIGFTNATTPLMYFFQSGTANPDRPILAHSPAYPNWGLLYRDPEDKMIFQGNGLSVLTLSLGGRSVGVGTDNPIAPLHVPGGAILNGLAVGIDPPGNINPPYPYETVSTIDPNWNLRLHSHNAILFHTGNRTNPTVGVNIDGTWYGSSRTIKQGIAELTSQEALETLSELQPVKFVFKEDDSQKQHAGFIAEETPDLISNPDKTMISTMDIIAVLTRVVKEQQQELTALRKMVKAFAVQNERS